MTSEAPATAPAHDAPAPSLLEGLADGRSARSAATSPETPGTTARTADRELSTRQTQILAFIGEATKRRGYAPSLREIASAVGLRSTSSVAYQVERLEEVGLLKRDPNVPRTYQVVTGVELPAVASDPQRSMCSAPRQHRGARDGIRPSGHARPRRRQRPAQRRSADRGAEHAARDPAPDRPRHHPRPGGGRHAPRVKATPLCPAAPSSRPQRRRGGRCVPLRAPRRSHQTSRTPNGSP